MTLINRTQRLCAMLVCLTLALGLAACGGADTASSADTQESAAESAEAAPADSQSASPSEDAAPAATTDFSGQTVRVTAWGGAYEETLRNIVKPAFEEKTGATMEIVLGSAPLAQLKAEGDSPSVDVMHLSYYEYQTAKMLEVSGPMDYSAMPNAANLYDKAKEDTYGVISNWGNWSYAYRTDLVGEPPTSWGDLWKPEYAGKVVIDDITFGGGYELSEMIARTFCDGKSLTDKSTWDTVFQKLEELSPNLYMVSTQHNDTENALLTGDALMAVNPNGRTARLITGGEENIGFADLKEGTPGMPTYVAIAKHSQVPELAQVLVNELIGVDAELAYAENNFYAPSNRECVVPEDIQGLMPYGEEAVEKLVFFDQEMFTEEERAEFLDRWNKALKNT